MKETGMKKCTMHDGHNSRKTMMPQLLFIILFACAHAHVELRLKKGHQQMRLLTNYNFGVRHLQLTGVLHVNDSSIVVNVLTFMKVCRAANGSLVCEPKCD